MRGRRLDAATWMDGLGRASLAGRLRPARGARVCFFGWFGWRILRQSRAAFAAALAGAGLWVLVLVLETACKFVAHVHPTWHSGQSALPVAEEFFEMSGATLLWAALLV